MASNAYSDQELEREAVREFAVDDPWLLPMLAPLVGDQAQVYFARRGDLIKIGASRFINDRMASLHYVRDPAGQVGDVELLLTIAGGFMLESYFHKRFARSSADRLGEWFHADADLLGFIALLRALCTVFKVPMHG